MIPSLDVLNEYWIEDGNGSYYMLLPNGGEVWLEKLLFDGQYYLAVYDRNQSLIGGKVCVKLGYATEESISPQSPTPLS